MIAYERFLNPSVVKPVHLGVESFLRNNVYGSLRYMFVRMLSCWHREMGRPITHNGRTYRACSRCGTRRDFDPKTWKTNGRYYSARHDQ